MDEPDALKKNRKVKVERIIELEIAPSKDRKVLFLERIQSKNKQLEELLVTMQTWKKR